MHWIALQWPPEGSVAGDGLPAAAAPPVGAAPTREALGWWALQFTPHVAWVDEALLLEVSASLRLWGGLKALMRRINESNPAPAVVQQAQAATGLVAIALLRLRSGRQALPADRPAALPLATLTAAQPHLPLFARLGCRTWGDVHALPRAPMVRRFGAELRRALDIAWGLAPESYPWLTLPERFDQRLELPQRADDAPALMWSANRLLTSLQLWLRARQLGVLAFELEWTLDLKRLDGRALPPTQSLVIGTAEPGQAMVHLRRLLAERLAHVSLLAPANGLRLRSLDTAPWVAPTVSFLPEDQRSGDPLHVFIERVSARLGVGSVQAPVLQADHRPECMQGWQAAEPGRPSPAASPTAQKRSGKRPKDMAPSPAGGRPGWGQPPSAMPPPPAPHPSPLPKGARAQTHPLPHGRPLPPLPLAGEGWGEGKAIEDAQLFFEPNRPLVIADKALIAIENEAYFSPSPAGGGPGWGPPHATRQSAGPHPSLPPVAEGARPAVRLGLRLAQGLNEAAARRIEQARAERPFTSVDDLARRAQLDVKALNQLAAADALITLAGHRRQQVWQGAALKSAPELLRDAPIDEDALVLPAAPEGEEIVHDYAALGLTLRRHPLALLRPRLARWRLRSAQELKAARHGEQVRACGIVIGRQQPGTAKGTIFVTLEDETGPVNVIVWKSVRVAEDQRNALLRSRLLAVQGEWQIGQDSGGHVRHLIAQRFVDLTPLLGRIAGLTTSRDFH